MKQCPNCKADQFKVKLSVIALATIGDDMSPVIQTTFPELTTIEELVCNSCNTVIKLEELNTKPCTKCGNLFKPEELNEKGHCKLCEIIEERFASMSQEDLIRTILQLEAEKEVAEKVDKPKTKRTRKAKAEDKIEQPLDPQAEEYNHENEEQFPGEADGVDQEERREAFDREQQAINNDAFNPIPTIPTQESEPFMAPPIPAETVSPFNEFDPNTVEFNF